MNDIEAGWAADGDDGGASGGALVRDDADGGLAAFAKASAVIPCRRRWKKAHLGP